MASTARRIRDHIKNLKATANDLTEDLQPMVGRRVHVMGTNGSRGTGQVIQRDSVSGFHCVVLDSGVLLCPPTNVRPVQPLKPGEPLEGKHLAILDIFDKFGDGDYRGGVVGLAELWDVAQQAFVMKVATREHRIFVRRESLALMVLERHPVEWPPVLDKFSKLEERIRLVNDHISNANSDQLQFFLASAHKRKVPAAHAGPPEQQYVNLPTNLSSILMPEMVAEDAKLAEAVSDAQDATGTGSSSGPDHEIQGRAAVAEHNRQVDGALQSFMSESRSWRYGLVERSKKQQRVA